MLYNSELVNSLERDLKGYKIAWDAGLPFDSKDWLVSWPKLNQEKKILDLASEDLKLWIKKWKSQRLIFALKFKHSKL